MHHILEGFLAWIETDQGNIHVDEDNTMQCVGYLREEIPEDNTSFFLFHLFPIRNTKIKSYRSVSVNKVTKIMCLTINCLPKYTGPCGREFKLPHCQTSQPQWNEQMGEISNLSSGTERYSSRLYDSANNV